MQVETIKPDSDAVHVEVDACGLNCPQPILRAKKALAKMESGQLLRVLATDAGSVKDFATFSQQTGNVLVSQISVNGIHQFLIRRR